jgi:D-lyxose ketol-isomerase
MQIHIPKRINKLWGYELCLVNNRMYCGKIIAVIPNGKCCSIHYHKLKTETFHIIEGKLILQLWTPMHEKHDLDCFKFAGTHELKIGNTITLKPWTAHRFYTQQNTDTKFIEFSTPDHISDSYRLVNSGDIPI